MSRGKNKIFVLAVAAVLVLGSIIFYISFASDNARVGRNLSSGKKYLEEGDYGEAGLCFEKVLEIDDSNTAARVGLVKVYVKTGDALRASGMLQDIDTITADAGVEAQLQGLLDVITELQKIITASGDEKAGTRSFKALCGIFPENTIIAGMYADFLLNIDKVDEAEELLLKFVSETGDDELKTKLSDIKFHDILPDITEGEYSAPCTVTIPVPADAILYYTLDGTEPSTASSVYTGPILLPEGDNELKLLPVLENGLKGKVKAYIYTVDECVFDPEYYIPELGRTYKYNITGSNGTFEKNVTWSCEGGKYIEKYDAPQASELGDTTYELAGDKLLIPEEKFGWYDSEYIFYDYEGEYVFLKKSRIGEKWNCSFYVPPYDGEGGYSTPYTGYELTGEFKGVEFVIVEGTKHAAFHICINEMIHNEEYGSYDVQNDYWIVEGHGLVRQLSVNDSSTSETILDGYEGFAE